MKEYYSFEQAQKILKLESEELIKIVEDGELRLFRDQSGMKFLKEHIDNFSMVGNTFTNLTSPKSETSIDFEGKLPPKVENSSSIKSYIKAPQEVGIESKLDLEVEEVESDPTVHRYKLYSKLCDRYKETNQVLSSISTILGAIVSLHLVFYEAGESKVLNDMLITLMGVSCFSLFTAVFLSLFSNIFLNRGQQSLELSKPEKNRLYLILKKILIKGVLLKSMAQFFSIFGTIAFLLMVITKVFDYDTLVGGGLLTTLVLAGVYCYRYVTKNAQSILKMEREKIGL